MRARLGRKYSEHPYSKALRSNFLLDFDDSVRFELNVLYDIYGG